MSAAKFGSGVVMGIVIGSVISMSMQKNHRHTASLKHNVGRTLRTLGNMVDSYK